VSETTTWPRAGGDDDGGEDFEHPVAAARDAQRYVTRHPEILARMVMAPRKL
jgi:hypothetical protein